MAIINSVRWVMMGFGTASLRGGTATSTTITSNAITAAISNLAQFINAGMYRVKVSGVDGGHAIASLLISATDGVTTIYLFPPTAITGGVNGQGMEVSGELQSDLNLKTFTATVGFVAGVTTGTVDLEVWGQENAGSP